MGIVWTANAIFQGAIVEQVFGSTALCCAAVYINYESIQTFIDTVQSVQVWLLTHALNSTAVLLNAIQVRARMTDCFPLFYVDVVDCPSHDLCYQEGSLIGIIYIYIYIYLYICNSL